MVRYRLVVLAVMAIGFGSCKKDAMLQPNGSSGCADFPDEPVPVISWFTNERFQWKAPFFNPNNKDEFVYNYFDFELQEFKLMKYNLGTKGKTELSNNARIISQPKWSNAGWIAYDNVLDYQLWVVKDNGDSLTQLTQSTHNLFPVWETSGIDLIWQHSPVLGIPYYLLKQNVLESSVDTIMRDGDENLGYAQYSDISVNNILLTNTFIENQSHLAYSNVENISFTSVFNIQEAFSTGSIRALTWSNNSQVAYFLFDGIYRLDVITGNYDMLMEFCETKKYVKISCSSDGTTLIGERVDSYLGRNSEGIPTGAIVQNSSIYLIDLATMEETKIELE